MTSLAQQTMPPKGPNPIGTRGFGFVEFVTAHKDSLACLFQKMGFIPVARHAKKDCTLYRFAQVDFMLTADSSLPTAAFAAMHGPSIHAFAFIVENTTQAIQSATSRGAQEIDPRGLISPQFRAIEGLGGSAIYMVDQATYAHVLDEEFLPLPTPNLRGLPQAAIHIDHLAHNLYRDTLPKWTEFYKNIFGFSELYTIDVMGEKSGLTTRIMLSPCQTIRLPLNIPIGDNSQIQEFLEDYNGEGIQHIAFGCQNIYKTIRYFTAQGIPFTSPPNTYYDSLEKTLAGRNIGEPMADMRALSLLLDIDNTGPKAKKLLQLFTKPLIGPIFFELIQRKGHLGFGENNIRALFKAMEAEQAHRTKI